MHKNLRRAALHVALAAWAALTLPAAAKVPDTESGEPLKVGFVFVSPIGEAGWTFQHNQGRRALEQALGSRVHTTVVESVPEGPDAERVMRDLASQGHRLIFATSFGYLESALRVAAEYPHVRFEHAGGWRTAANVNTYNARFYEARWLAGWLAGRSSTRGVAGYVAGFPVPEVIQGINAFTLGMRAAKPQAEVRVLWLNTWFDSVREREAAQTLVRQGADVLTNHSGSPAVPKAAEEMGVRLVAYQSDMRHFAPSAQLAAITHHWGGYYTRVALSLLDDRWRAQPVWGGMKDGMVRLEALHSSLPADVVASLERLRADIEAGRRHVFEGRLVDQQARVRQESGRLSDERIATMDWFVQGVVGRLPKP